jgi:hypothetical protein
MKSANSMVNFELIDPRNTFSSILKLAKLIVMKLSNSNGGFGAKSPQKYIFKYI